MASQMTHSSNQTRSMMTTHHDKVCCPCGVQVSDDTMVSRVLVYRKDDSFV
jgi:hypothetical protein